MRLPATLKDLLMLRIAEDALTFDDVLLVPGYSNIIPANVSLKTQITRTIELNMPLLSAAMDTVTESSLAIAMAQAGGIGVLHKNFSIEEQSNQVRSVKRFEAGMVVNPLTINPNKTLGEALETMRSNQISGVPVVHDNNLLVGILTNRDVRFATDMSKTVSDLMTKNVISVTEETSAEEARSLLHKHRIEKLVVTNQSNQCIGLITVKDIEKAENHPLASKDDAGRLLVAAATGAGNDGIERAEALIEAGVDVVVVDTAHGQAAGIAGQRSILTPPCIPTS